MSSNATKTVFVASNEDECDGGGFDWHWTLVAAEASHNHDRRCLPRGTAIWLFPVEVPADLTDEQITDYVADQLYALQVANKGEIV